MPIVPDVPTPPPRRRRSVREEIPEVRQAKYVAEVDPVRLLAPYDGPRTASNEFRDRYAILRDIDPELAKDHALDTLSRLLMAKMTLDQIARTMNVSTVTVCAWKNKLRERLKASVKRIDIHTMIGSLIAEDEELKAQGWRDIQAAQKIETIDDPTAPSGKRQVVVVDWKRRRHGADLVLKAKASIMRVLDQTGALDTAPLRSAIETGDDPESHANALKDLAQSFLQGGYKKGRMPNELDEYEGDD